MSGFEYHFEWNDLKAASNVAKHGVSFGAATTVLRDPLAITLFDAEHSTQEQPRWVTVGRAFDGSCLVLVHTWEDLSPDAARVRIISARHATGREQRAYEEGQL